MSLIDKDNFEKAFRLGLGQTILSARLHDLTAFSDIVLDTCLHCYSYDVQIEGTRAIYVHDLISALPDKEFYFREIARSMKGCGDDASAALRFELSGFLASDGNDEVRRAMFEAYNPGPNFGDHIGIVFVQMDGIQGLVFVAGRIGEALLGKTTSIDVGWLLSRTLELCGEQAPWEALKDAGSSEPCVEAFRLAGLESVRQIASPPSQPTNVDSMSYEQVMEEVPANKPYLLTKWGEQAAKDELKMAAEGLIAANELSSQLAHLRIFARRTFPPDLKALVRLVDVNEYRISYHAVRALGQVSSPEVRYLALRLVSTQGHRRGAAIGLIAQNFQPGDHDLILRWFEDEYERETLHTMSSDLLDFWKRHPDQKTEPHMLRAIYEKGPCSVCRERTVRQMIELNELTEDLRLECAWDSNSIRDLVIR